jgi:hypothetical protein
VSEPYSKFKNSAFKRQIAGFVKRAEGNMDIVVRKIALDLLTALVKRSPVDTGRFRGNWVVQEAIVPTTSDSTEDNAVETGSVEIARFRAGGRLYILNHLPYSIALERGHSQQAPAGMVRITVAEFKQYLRKAGMEITK